jgi:GrpB-like predicted nucleotidyltransferase (UPF0157 family)
VAAVSPIEIVPYDPTWPARFEEEAARLSQALGDLAVAIEHIGSTSVPGLAAKPVVDIQISVARLDPLDTILEPLAGAGYTHAPSDWDAFYPFFHKPATWPHAFHVHVCTAGGREERRHLAFRDHLRAHPDAAREYEALKRRLAAVHSAETIESRQAYSDAKSEFIAPIQKELGGPVNPRRTRCPRRP